MIEDLISSFPFILKIEFWQRYCSRLSCPSVKSVQPWHNAFISNGTGANNENDNFHWDPGQSGQLSAGTINSPQVPLYCGEINVSCWNDVLNVANCMSVFTPKNVYSYDGATGWISANNQIIYDRNNLVIGMHVQTVWRGLFFETNCSFQTDATGQNRSFFTWDFSGVKISFF